MDSISFIIVAIFYRLSLYTSNTVSNLENTAEKLNKSKNKFSQTKQFERSKSNNKLFLKSEFPTHITIFHNGGIIFQGDQSLKLGQNCAKKKKNVANKPMQAQYDTVSLKSKIISLFINRLENLTELQRELVKTSYPEPDHIINISSSFFLTNLQRQFLTSIIRAKINDKAEIEFHLTQKFDFGIELCDRGYKIFSNLDTCITEIDERVANQAIKEKAPLKQLMRTG